MTSKTITERQKSFLLYIKAFTSVKGWPPTLRDVTSHFKLKSPGTMCRTLQMLVDRGYLEKENDIARGYKVILDESEWNVVPGIPSNITIREERQMDEEEPDLKEYEIKAAAYQRIRYRREIRDAVVRCEWKLVVELGQRLMKLGHE